MSRGERYRAVVSSLLTLAFVTTSAAEANVGIEEIARAIEAHITEKSAADGGVYRLTHDGRSLELELVRVHMEYLADLGGGVQFACVDLVGRDGPVYDVDFFLRGEAGNMVVTETTVHKVNGQPLYAWEQTEAGSWKRVAVSDASPRLLGVLQGRDEFEFTYRVHLPEIRGAGNVWIPLARSDAFQSVEVEEIVSPTHVRTLVESTHGNRVLFATVGPSESGQTIIVRYRVRRDEQSPYPVEETAREIGLAPERLVPDADVFREIAIEVTRGKTTDLMRARALYDHVIDQVRYARFGPGWGRGDALYACDAKSGNCTDFHSYFIALSRAVGIPARFTIGAAIPSERNEGGIDGYHCWAEFFAEGRWWPVDISEADKNSSLASYYFGHQPANRLELSRGRDLVLDPGPTSGPINFLAYALLEVDGEALRARTEFTFRRFERDAAD